MLALHRLGLRLVGRREGALRDRRNVFLPKYSPGKNNGNSFVYSKKARCSAPGLLLRPWGYRSLADHPS